MNIVNQRTKIIFGANSMENLKDIKNKNIIVISDKVLFENGLLKKATDNIDFTNKVVVFDEVKPDPPLSVVSKAISQVIKNKIDLIIAFGGGSAIDTAKGIIYFLKRYDSDIKFEFIAIPTTSGTGSEVTSVSVITDEFAQIKHLISDDDILPDIAILDSSLTKSLPKSVIANTGIDVLTHAVESYVSINANDYSDTFAEKAGQLIFKHLLNSYNTNDDYSRDKMHIASNLAGSAFNISGLGLNHSIAHQLGGIYHIPHGLANAIVFTKVIDCNARNKIAKEKYSKFAKVVGISNYNVGCDRAVDELKVAVKKLVLDMDMPDSISACGIELSVFKKDRKKIVDNTMKDRCTVTNPLQISAKEIIEILEKVY